MYCFIYLCQFISVFLYLQLDSCSVLSYEPSLEGELDSQDENDDKMETIAEDRAKLTQNSNNHNNNNNNNTQNSGSSESKETTDRNASNAEPLPATASIESSSMLESNQSAGEPDLEPVDCQIKVGYSFYDYVFFLSLFISFSFYFSSIFYFFLYSHR
jgi:hypothetical protein